MLALHDLPAFALGDGPQQLLSTCDGLCSPFALRQTAARRTRTPSRFLPHPSHAQVLQVHICDPELLLPLRLPL